MQIQQTSYPKLIRLSGSVERKVFSITNEKVSIGRAEDNDIYLDDPKVSHHHAEIFRIDDRYYLKDCNSTNGTFVNSSPVEQVELKEGDKIKIGRVKLFFTFATDIDKLNLPATDTHNVEVVSEGDDSHRSGTIEMAVPTKEIDLAKGTPPDPSDITAVARMHKRLSILYKISRKMSGLSELDALLNLIMSIIFDEMSIDRGIIMLLDKEDDELKPRITRTRESIEQNGTIKVSRTIIEQAIKSRQSILTKDASTDRRFDGTESVTMMGIRSAICVPLIVKDKILGILYVDRLSRPKSFSKDDLEFLTAICNEAAISIENAQLFTEIQKANEELRSLNEQLSESNLAYKKTNEKLRASYRKLEETQQRLIQAEKLSSIGRLIAGVAHDLKTIVAAVTGYAGLLERATSQERRQEILQKLNRSTDACIKIVRDLLNFARQEKLHKEKTNINSLVQEAVDVVSAKNSISAIQFIQKLDENLPQIFVDRTQIARVFTNIIDNAVQAMMNAYGHGTLTVQTYFDSDFLYIKFIDTGPGISEEIINKIFDPFFTTKEKGKSTGLGLSLCHGLISAHSGEINVESEVGKGATFTVKLPVKSDSVSPNSSEEM